MTIFHPTFPGFSRLEFTLFRIFFCLNDDAIVNSDRTVKKIFYQNPFWLYVITNFLAKHKKVKEQMLCE